MTTKHIPFDCTTDEMVTKEDFANDQSIRTQQHIELMDTQEEILKQLKILNTYLAMMTNTNIRSE